MSVGVVYRPPVATGQPITTNPPVVPPVALGQHNTGPIVGGPPVATGQPAANVTLPQGTVPPAGGIVPPAGIQPAPGPPGAGPAGSTTVATPGAPISPPIPTKVFLREQLLAYLQSISSFATRDVNTAASLTRKGLSWLHNNGCTNTATQEELMTDVMPLVLVASPIESSLVRAAQRDEWWEQHSLANSIARGQIPVATKPVAALGSGIGLLIASSALSQLKGGNSVSAACSLAGTAATAYGLYRLLWRPKVVPRLFGQTE